jgi:dTDP-glucose 4,6-dehydratase
LENEEALDGTIYNVGTVEEISIVDLVILIAEKMDIQNLEITFDGYRESDPERRLLNVEKITHRTSWKPSIDLGQGLDMCIKEKLNNV